MLIRPRPATIASRPATPNNSHLSLFLLSLPPGCGGREGGDGGAEQVDAAGITDPGIFGFDGRADPTAGSLAACEGEAAEPGRVLGTVPAEEQPGFEGVNIHVQPAAGDGRPQYGGVHKTVRETRRVFGDQYL